MVLTFPIALTMLASVPARADIAEQGRSPIIYNLEGYEVGVIEDLKTNGDALVLPTKATVDLGYYKVIMPAASLRPRSRGGWETSMTTHDMEFLPPVTPRFFMPSGD
ncbi:MAG TPA: hypothetical protein VNX61_12185 [Rhizomicrobium sp.]|nr:hypothetical protein [Rhizomicrobium sp.]